MTASTVVRRDAASLFAIIVLALTDCTRTKPVASKDAMADMPGMAGVGAAADSGVLLDRSAAARLGITFAKVTRDRVSRGLRFAGTVRYAEPERAYVSVRVNGWVEHLDANFAGKQVRQGDTLLTLYSPELASAQDEYLSARKLNDSSLVAASRRRLGLWGLPAAEIAQLERSGQAQRTMVMRAPRSGEIAEKMVTEGQAVHAGDNLFLIADRSTVWVDIAIFEMDAGSVPVGTPVTITLAALPGQIYSGRVTFIQPSVDEQTRTLTARVEVANRDGQLRPGMYATAGVSAVTGPGLAVPSDAVLATGTRNLVFVNRGDGAFVPREVQIGIRGDSLTEIRHGLRFEDEVVASAAYLLDSESNLAAAMQGLMLRMGMGLNRGGVTTPPAAGDKRAMPKDSSRGVRP